MSTQTYGLISGALVLASAVYYFIRVYQRKVNPAPTSWAIWTFVSWTLLLSYWTSGASEGDAFWPALLGAASPTSILILTAKRGRWAKPDGFERLCIALCVSALSLWFFVHDDRALSFYALSLALLADFSGLLPTIRAYLRGTATDRPLPWFVFGTGYGLALLAVPESSIEHVILPFYMLIGANTVAVILAAKLMRARAPLSAWY